MNQEQVKGIIFAAPGTQFIDEALVSASSIKVHNPHLSVTVFTDCIISSPYFDNTIHIKPVEMRFMDKILCLARSPYVRTLFLDCDTYICDGIDNMFSLLDDFDVAVAHAPFRVNPPNYRVLKTFIDTIPDSFPQFNTGVILYRRSPATASLWKSFALLHQRDWDFAQQTGTGFIDDQPAFREALYHSQVRFATLPTEYNCRFSMPATPRTTGFLGEPAKILHGRAPNLDVASRTLNTLPGPRVHMLYRGVLKVFNWSGAKISQRLWWHTPFIFHKMQRLGQLLREEGIRAVLRKIKQKLNNLRT